MFVNKNSELKATFITFKVSVYSSCSNKGGLKFYFYILKAVLIEDCKLVIHRATIYNYIFFVHFLAARVQSRVTLVKNSKNIAYTYRT